MPGLAQILYAEREKENTSFPFPERERAFFPWPVLEKLYKSGRLLYIDCVFVRKIFSDFCQIHEDLVAFLLHLFISSREGHLCVRICHGKVFPDPSLSWLAPFEERLGEDRLSLEELKEIKEGIIRGSQKLPDRFVCDVGENFPEKSQIIFRLGNLFYLQKHWVHESLFIEHFQRLLKMKPQLSLERELFNSKLEQLKIEEKLLGEQILAIKAAGETCFTIITGGPGTGKTYTAGYLIKIFVETLFHGEQKKIDLSLASPTGKAAANLQASLLVALDGLPKTSLQLSAKTLHSLLGINRRGRREHGLNNPLSSDFILVDESSMIDVHLMAQLFSSIKPGARLILLGDKDQLPPVESGGLFADLTRLCRYNKGLSKHLFELRKCMRSNLEEIVEFSHLVNRGEVLKILDVLRNHGKDSAVQRVFLKESHHSFQQSLLDYMVKFFPLFKGKGMEEKPREVMDAFQQFRILSPLRKGPMGVDTINKLLLEHFMWRLKDEPCFVAPIMIVNNHYRMELYNGEVGVLFRFFEGNSSYHKRDDYAVFPGRDLRQVYFDENLQVRKIPSVLLPRYEYAYCLSVHKSQGSEFDTVLLFLPEGSEVFGREVLYTAVTRSRKKLKIFSDEKVFHSVLNRSLQRESGVCERIKSV